MNTTTQRRESHPELAELPGEFGPVTVSERVVQRIWLRQDFHPPALLTRNGHVARIRRPGQWNLQEGPDFREALWETNGQTDSGDVEIHFYPGDWFAHGHHQNPAYNRVGLHIVVFDDGGPSARTADGRQPETVALLPALNRDLEAHAAEDALLALTGRDHRNLLEIYLCLPPPARREELAQLGLVRWRQKLAFARQRLDRLGWDSACHHAVLETLGYRRNRAPMSTLATRFPAEIMCAMDAGRLFDFAKDQWKLAGLRPANHPRQRLMQYLRLLKHDRHWPERLRAWGNALPSGLNVAEPTAAVRKQADFKAWKEALARDVFGGAIGGTRLDTLTADAVFPLLAAANRRDLHGWWHHWHPGDAPEALCHFLRESGATSTHYPRSNGLLQGALQCLFTQEAA